MLRRVFAAGGLLLAGSALFGPSSASAAESDLLVTIAARVCPDYTDITANRARNNIQESLRDLGVDTPYKDGELVDASVEDRAQPNCKPIEGWRLTLGKGIKSKAAIGPWGSMSAVTQPFSDEIVTRESTPLLDDRGEKTGSDLQGAVTYELTPEQQRLAAKSSSLWIQGGKPDDPVLYDSTGGAYGFGAIRCAADDLNGDNVEFITFPSGRRHVFCFAYYVSPPPTAGAIVVRKETVGQPAGETERFPFQGNISFEPGGTFDLSASEGKPAQKTFFRAEVGPGDPPWRFAESLPPNWELADLQCRSTSGASTFEVDQGQGSAAVDLAAADLVTCTYTNRYRPPPGGLQLRKVTRGGTGTFPFEIDAVGGGQSERTSVETIEEGVAAAADPIDLEPGRYTIREQRPESSRGKWSLTSVECDGEELPVEGDQEVTIASKGSTVCTYTNIFVPDGSIKVNMVTLGGTGSVGYQVDSLDPSAPTIAGLFAKTTRPGDPVRATGDDLSRVPLGPYSILQNTFASGSWRLIAVSCNGKAVPFDQGEVDVRLTVEEPEVECTFVNRPEPDGGGGGGPTPGPIPSEPETGSSVVDPPGRGDDDRADLRVTKVAADRRVRLGERVFYRLTVRNAGPDTAYNVSVAEQLLTSASKARLISIESSSGRCVQVRIARGFAPICLLGDLAPGDSVTVRAVLEPTKTGVYRNRAAASSDTVDSNPKAAIASEKITVLKRRSPPDGPPTPEPCRC